MSLKVLDGAELHVEKLVVLVYGAPGVGKTSLALTAKSPLVLAFDSGIYRAVGRAGKSVVQVNSWADVADLGEEDVKPYKTLVIDTLSSFLEVLIRDVIDKQPNLGRGGVLTLQGYGVLGARAVAWMRKLRSLGLDIVFVAHTKEEQRGDEIVNRIEATGGFRTVVCKEADLIGQLTVRANGTRVLSFDPTDVSFGKNVGLPPVEVPLVNDGELTLASVLRHGKDEINLLHAKQEATRRYLETVRVHVVTEVKEPEDMAKIVEQYRTKHEKDDDELKTIVSKVLKDAGKSLGIRWDKEKGEFVRKEEKPAAEAAKPPEKPNGGQTAAAPVVSAVPGAQAPVAEKAK